jgi:FixJ family two-component response regulator
MQWFLCNHVPKLHGGVDLRQRRRLGDDCIHITIRIHSTGRIMARGALPGETIYIVDGDAGVRDGLRALFEAHGHAVRDFASGAEFLTAYAPAMAGCVLLDVNLAGFDCYEVLKMLTAVGSRLPVIIMTTTADREAGVHAARAGATDVIAKPFIGAHMMGLIRDALHGARARA